jgi:hypothetical protein
MTPFFVVLFTCFIVMLISVGVIMSLAFAQADNNTAQLGDNATQNLVILAKQSANAAATFDKQMSSGVLTHCSDLGTNTIRHTPNFVYTCGIGCGNARDNLMAMNNTDYNNRLQQYNTSCGNDFVTEHLEPRP